MCFGNIPKEYAETAYNKKGLPGNNFEADSSSSPGGRIGNAMVGKVEVNGKD